MSPHDRERAREEYVSAEQMASVHVGLDDSNAAFEALERAVAERSACMIYVAVDPQYALVHRDPRFTGLRQRMNEGIRS